MRRNPCTRCIPVLCLRYTSIMMASGLDPFARSSWEFCLRAFPCCAAWIVHLVSPVAQDEPIYCTAQKPGAFTCSCFHCIVFAPLYRQLHRKRKWNVGANNCRSGGKGLQSQKVLRTNMSLIETTPEDDFPLKCLECSACAMRIHMFRWTF